MRTDISEDAKGDPSRNTPGQPEPGRGRPPGVEPLLPKPDRDAAPSQQSDDETNIADRVEGGPEHDPDDAPHNESDGPAKPADRR